MFAASKWGGAETETPLTPSITLTWRLALLLGRGAATRAVWKGFPTKALVSCMVA